MALSFSLRLSTIASLIGMLYKTLLDVLSILFLFFSLHVILLVTILMKMTRRIAKRQMAMRIKFVKPISEANTLDLKYVRPKLSMRQSLVQGGNSRP